MAPDPGRHPGFSGFKGLQAGPVSLASVRLLGGLTMRQLLALVGVAFLIALAPCLPAAENRLGEKAASDWLYPGARVIHSGQAGAVSCVVAETADDVSKVLKHY